jgi:hypothetical protein
MSSSSRHYGVPMAMSTVNSTTCSPVENDPSTGSRPYDFQRAGPESGMPLVQDSRAFTDWSTSRSEKDRGFLGSNLQTRQAMISNADIYIKEQRDRVFQKLRCGDCYSVNQPGTTHPQLCSVMQKPHDTGQTPFFSAMGIPAMGEDDTYASAHAYSTS